MSYKNTVAKNFDIGSYNYDNIAHVQNRAAQELVQKIKDFCILKNCASVLDIGTGTGTASQLLCDILPNATYHLNDISVEMLKVATSKFKTLGVKFEAVYGDAEMMHFHMVDLVISNFAMQWFYDIESTLLNLSKIGNIIAFSMPIRGSFQHLEDFYKQYNVPSNISDYQSFDEIVKICLSLKPLHYQFDKIIYNVSHPTPLHFMRHLKSLGAGTTKYDVPKKVLYQFARNKESFIANYDVFFGILLCNHLR
ncbi:MAG: methyltransferase domain-containing protein [Candidatus Lariskella arthropodorum]